MDTLKENLKVAQPEIEPLQNKQNHELPNSRGSINSSQHNIDIYKTTTTAKPTVIYQVCYFFLFSKAENFYFPILLKLTIFIKLR